MYFAEKTIRHRPKTRGELIDCLKKDIECEVVTSNKETTNMLIDGWLNFAGKYKTYDSENTGWTVYSFVQN